MCCGPNLAEKWVIVVAGCNYAGLCTWTIFAAGSDGAGHDWACYTRTFTTSSVVVLAVVVAGYN